MKDKVLVKIIIGIFITGFIASIFSFIYFYVCDYDFKILVIINIIDVILLIINVVILICLLELDSKKLVINTILTTLIYYCIFMSVGLAMFKENITINNIINVFEFAVFLGPSLIILVPIYYVIGSILA